MPKTASFSDLSAQALKLALRCRTGWLFAWAFGVSALLQTHIPMETVRLPEHASSFSSIFTPELAKVLSTALAIIALAALLRMLARGPLLLALDASREEKTDGGLSGRTLLRSVGIVTTFEIGYWLSLLFLGGFLSLPVGLALGANPSLASPIAHLSAILLLSIALYLFLLKEFALFYVLFGRSRFLTSLELGLRLLRRHTFLALLFGLFTSLLALLFTFAIDSVMLMVAELARDDVRMLLESVLTVLFFGSYALFDQALRLLFFRSLAATPGVKPKKVGTLEPVESTPGAPTS